jgi:hypothetical protein
MITHKKTAIPKGLAVFLDSPSIGQVFIFFDRAYIFCLLHGIKFSEQHAILIPAFRVG